MIFISSFLLISCGPSRAPAFSTGHLKETQSAVTSAIPEPIQQSTLLAPPVKRPPIETYTVIVSSVLAKDLLFSIARDAKINLDIHDDIEGRVTLNAIDQTLPQILERIAQQVDIRYNFEENTLRIRADSPYLETYQVDYVNISRTSKGVVRVATNIGSTGQGSIGDNNQTSSSKSENNSSLTEVRLSSDNMFWETLTHNITEILNDKSDTDSSNASNQISGRSDNNNVIVNRESGMIMVRATAKQQQQIQNFIGQVLNNSKRQVMIEATIAEIKLSDRYQAGVDWTLISNNPLDGTNILTDLRAGNLGQSPFSSFSLSDINDGDQVNVTLRALEQFGDVKVLSSPKVMAINNQPAILKVVDNIVYFEMEVDTSVSETQSLTTFETEIKTVPVGFVMSVTPYINEHEVVTLNIRPTISRVIDSVVDPNPAFKEADVISQVPVIQVREIESILSINSGDTAVIGGLMQDTVNDNKSGIPILSTLPIIGSLFRYEDDVREKSELVIFIRPVVIHHASLNGDLESFKQYLPVSSTRNIVNDNKTPEQATAHGSTEQP